MFWFITKPNLFTFDISQMINEVGIFMIMTYESNYMSRIRRMKMNNEPVKLLDLDNKLLDILQNVFPNISFSIDQINYYYYHR